MKEIHVEDMKCIHCQEKIQKALKLNRIAGKVLLETKTVEVDDGDAERAIETIRKAGYTPSL